MRECLDIKWDDLLDVDHSSLGEIWGKNQIYPYKGYE